jgi:hypothetical protein
MQTNGHTWELTMWRGPKPPERLKTVSDHRVAFLSRQEDLNCAMLAEFGIGMKAIARRTGLSVGQVSYRLQKLGISVRDFREGRGPYAKLVFEGLEKAAARQLTADIRMRELKA